MTTFAIAFPAWLGGALADVALKGAILLLVAAVVVRLLRNGSAAMRHLAWTVGLVSVLALPALRLTLPRLRVDSPVPWPSSAAVSAQSRFFSIEPVVAVEGPGHGYGRHGLAAPEALPELPALPELAEPAELSGAAEWGGLAELEHTDPGEPARLAESAAADLPVRFAPHRGGPGAEHEEHTGTRVIRAWPTTREPAAADPALIAGVPADAPWSGGRVTSLADFAVLLWLLGVVIVALPLIRGLWQLRRFAHRAADIDDDRILDWARVARTELGVTRRVRLLAGPPGAMPITWGVLQPVVLLPAGAVAWSDERMLAVLRHEFAHVARRDSLTQLAGELATAMYWFNPLVWLAAKRQRVEREHACDDLVLSCGPRASDYADALVDLARTLRASRTTSMAALAMARPGGLRDRLVAVLDEGRDRTRLDREAAWRFTLFSALPVLLLACVAPTHSQMVPVAIPADVAWSSPEPPPSPPQPDYRLPIEAPDGVVPPGTFADMSPHPTVSIHPMGLPVPPGSVRPPAGGMQGGSLSSRVLRQAARHDLSDSELAGVLLAAAEGGLREADTQRAWFEAAAQLDSDYELRRVVADLIRRDARPTTIALALDAASHIGSDFECATLLLGIMEVSPITGDLREPFDRALAGIGSEYEHNRVAGALLRKQRD